MEKLRHYAIIFFLLCQNIVTAQSSLTVPELRRKSDLAYLDKNYSLSASYLDRAIELLEANNNKLGYPFYYDASCVYALNNEKEKAIRFLEMSFSLANAESSIPVSGTHILSDNDLNSIRKEPEFINLLKKYYPTMPFDLVIASEISYNDLLSLLSYMSEQGDRMVIRDKLIFFKKENGKIEYNGGPLRIPDFKHKRKWLEFHNCNFQLDFTWVESQEDFGRVSFENCHFNGLFIFDKISSIEPPYFNNSTFENNFWLRIKVNPEANRSNGFGLGGCHLKRCDIAIEVSSPIEIGIGRNIQTDSSDIIIVCNNSEKIHILDNKLGNKNIYIRGETSALKIENNSFNNIILYRLNIKDEFDFEVTKLNGKLLLGSTFFNQDPANDIDWNYLSNHRLGSLTSISWGLPVQSKENRQIESMSGESLEDISNHKSFRELMGLYSMFLNLYKNKNDIESYNGCYVDIKELQSKRLKYLYESNKSFETYFRWKLSQLLKFYVRHGTDPARAIVISIYIIFCFGVFFFFFPSDWDVTSKKKLIQNFKDFAQKNEKGYVKPFFILVWGFAISLLNALTLSLNAFITLGFGNIPTHGVARYICVLEGFLGWFLLSIFTVALINQVL